eukprot:SAG11_NODE_6662_length_1271_cov_1.700512_1_plen_91_part_00
MDGFGEHVGDAHVLVALCSRVADPMRGSSRPNESLELLESVEDAEEGEKARTEPVGLRSFVSSALIFASISDLCTLNGTPFLRIIVPRLI